MLNILSDSCDRLYETNRLRLKELSRGAKLFTTVKSSSLGKMHFTGFKGECLNSMQDFIFRKSSKGTNKEIISLTEINKRWYGGK